MFPKKVGQSTVVALGTQFYQIQFPPKVYDYIALGPSHVDGNRVKNMVDPLIDRWNGSKRNITRYDM